MSSSSNNNTNIVDPDLPLDPEGKVYHLACKSENIAKKIILVGDPARVAVVASRFDDISEDNKDKNKDGSDNDLRNKVIFQCSNREICVMTGRYKGHLVTVISTGMGTDNTEIVINELHTLLEYDFKNKRWRYGGKSGNENLCKNYDKLPKNERFSSENYDKSAEEFAKGVHIIRVGTCGSPIVDKTVKAGTLAITEYTIGMDNTCRWYCNFYSDEGDNNNLNDLKMLEKKNVEKLQKVIDNFPELNKAGGCYAGAANEEIVNELINAAKLTGLKKVNLISASKASYDPPKDNILEGVEKKLQREKNYVVGITATASGFYACQGRTVGRFHKHITVPNLVEVLGRVEFEAMINNSSIKDDKFQSNIDKNKDKKVVSIEMECSAVCTLSRLLGYKAGAICTIIAKRAGDFVEFAPHDVAIAAINDAITIALEALIAVSNK